MTPDQPMKVIYFEMSQLDFHTMIEATGFYVPNQDVILYAKTRMVDAPVYNEILDGVRNIASGNKAPESFRNVSEFEYDALGIMALIEDARLRADLNTRIDLGIEELLKQVK